MPLHYLSGKLMRIVSWNINGLRSSLKKDFAAQMSELQADVICLQEIKTDQQQLRGSVLPGYQENWNSSSVRKGYSGTLTLTRNTLASRTGETSVGMQQSPASGEGRVLTTEFDTFYLVNVYAPNAQSKLKRLAVRLDWDKQLQTHARKLEQTKPVIICGDLNVAHNEIDLAHPARNRGKSGFSDPERDSFSKLLALGYTDAFRHFEQGPEHYTYWRFNKGVREKNLGWRIDYFIVSNSIADGMSTCYHLPDMMGSDHCPVVLKIDD